MGSATSSCRSDQGPTRAFSQWLMALEALIDRRWRSLVWHCFQIPTVLGYSRCSHWPHANGQSGGARRGSDRCLRSLVRYSMVSYSRRVHRHPPGYPLVLRAEPAADPQPWPPSLAHELATGICCASGDVLWLEVEAPPMPNRCLHLAQTAVAA